MEPVSWTYLIANVGFPIAMVIYFVISNKRRDEASDRRAESLNKQALEREARLGERIDQLEDDHRKELAGLIREGVAAQLKASEVQLKSVQTIQETNEINKRLSRNMDRIADRLDKRPCLGVHATDEPLPRSQDTTGQTTRSRTRIESTG